MRRNEKITLDSGDWVDRLRGLAGDERRSLVEFLLLLGRVDHSRLYLPLGYASTWDFVRRGIGFSERMTFYRVAAARVLLRFPFAVGLLRSGALCMTTLATLAPVLTEDNARAVLDEAVGKGKDQVASIKARLDPRSSLPRDVVHPFSVRREVNGVTGLTPGDVVESWNRRHMNTDSEFEDLLRRLRMAYSHRMSGASEMEILKAVMRQALALHEKQKGIVDRPRPPVPEVTPRGGTQAILAHVKRSVWLRDEGRCQWPTVDGDICGSTLRVEFHHLLDRGKGGLHTAENLMLACAIHNRYAAELVWGPSLSRRGSAGAQLCNGAGAGRRLGRP